MAQLRLRRGVVLHADEQRAQQDVRRRAGAGRQRLAGQGIGAAGVFPRSHRSLAWRSSLSARALRGCGRLQTGARPATRRWTPPRSGAAIGGTGAAASARREVAAGARRDTRRRRRGGATTNDSAEARDRAVRPCVRGARFRGRHDGGHAGGEPRTGVAASLGRRLRLAPSPPRRPRPSARSPPAGSRQRARWPRASSSVAPARRRRRNGRRRLRAAAAARSAQCRTSKAGC